ncbi:kinesin-like protein KIN-14L [Wolffia australiana]
MGEQKDRWTWEVAGFEPRKPVEQERAARRQASLAGGLSRRYSISASSSSPRSEVSKLALGLKLQKLKDQLKNAKEEYLELRQETSDLREYSIAKLDRVSRYLSVLAEKVQKLDKLAVDSEARANPLVIERKQLFNELLTDNANIRFFCRTRPLFEDEGLSVVEFPDEHSIRIKSSDRSLSGPKEFQFDKVYGPHIGHGEIFNDVQPLVQSALDGFNVSIFAYGSTRAGKTYTMEGSSHDRGLYVRSFEELFDLSFSDTTARSQYDFYVTVSELYNEQVRDLLSAAGYRSPKFLMGPLESYTELVAQKVDNPLSYSRILKAALRYRETEASKISLCHLMVTIHIRCIDQVSQEQLDSKLSLVDLGGSEELLGEDSYDITHSPSKTKSLSVLGDVLSAVTSKMDSIPYEDSMLTNLLSDSLGGNSRTLMIVNICPSALDLSRSLSSLSFYYRARSSEINSTNQDTVKKWMDTANGYQKKLRAKEKELNDLTHEIMNMKLALKEADDQCCLLFNEVQKAWKVSFTLQRDLNAENTLLYDRERTEKEKNVQLKDQIAHLLQSEQEHKMQIRERDLTIQNLQAKVQGIESQLNEALKVASASESASTGVFSSSKGVDETVDSSSVTKKLEEELAKRDALIQKLHEENEKLFDKLKEKASLPGPKQASSPFVAKQAKDTGRPESNKGQASNLPALPAPAGKSDASGAIVKVGPEKGKSTPAGEYLTAALMDYDPDQFESYATVADGANKLLMLVLAAVIKAGAAREHEILAEIRDAVFSFLRKMESRQVMDTMLVSRVRILYVRSLVARSPELQSIKVFPVERFLDKPSHGRTRSPSRSNSPGRSPGRYDSNMRNALVEENYIHPFKVNIKHDKKSKFSSMVSKLRGIDQEQGRQHITAGKLREITEDAKAYANGNKSLAALFVHTPAGELQRQIRSWLTENFEFLAVTGGDASGELELVSTAIMDGWMAGLGTAQPTSTDALGLILSEYTRRVYTSQLQHLKDIAGTLAMEEAEDPAQVLKLRSALESVDHKRRKLLQQMKSDTGLLSKEDGGQQILNPSTAAEDARLASLISLDGILKGVKEVMKYSSAHSLTKSKKKSLLSSLNELSEQMPSLLDIDHPCAQKEITEARQAIEAIPEDDTRLQEVALSLQTTETEVNQWNILQFNTGSSKPFIIKCGANSRSDLVVKADARVEEPKGGEIIRVAPKPSVVADLSLEEIKELFSHLPEALSQLSLARTADGTRARYSRLYRTLATKVPSLKDVVSEMEKAGLFKDVKQ